MAVLEMHSRPWTVFDARNREHRKHYDNFVRTRGWGHCPVRFVVPDGSQDLLTMIRNSLLDYYMQREFPDNAGKTSRKLS
jgi:hypothetical protein